MYLPAPDEFRSHSCVITNHCTDERGGSGELAVWNPFLRQVKWIEPSKSYKDDDVYGFGYDNVSRENYKILRFDNEFGKSSEADIYEFKSKRWRSVDATETPESRVAKDYYRSRVAVSMSGNMYWAVDQLNTDGYKIETFIKSFDFSTETFKRICSIPDTFCECFHQPIVALSCFGGDRLSLFRLQIRVKIEVLVTNKVTDAVVSWSKFFNVTPPHLQILGLYSSRGSFMSNFIVHKSNKIMLWCQEVDDQEEFCRANIYEMGEGQIKKQFEETRPCKRYDPFLMFVCNVYVPSLVPVPE